MSETAEPRAARPTRTEQTQRRRRRRESIGVDRNLKLHVPDEFKDRNFEYRWVNDRPGRVQQLHGEDWDVVETASGDVESAALGTQLSRVADKFSGERTVLMRKPKEFFEEDRKEKEKVLDRVEEALRSGAAPSPQGLSGPEAYVPGGRNIIGGR